MLMSEWVILATSLALILLSFGHGSGGLKIAPIAYMFFGWAGWGVILWFNYLLNPLGRSGNGTVLIALGYIMFTGIQSGRQDTFLYKSLILVFIPIVTISYLIPIGPGSLIQFLIVIVYLLVGVLFFRKPKETKQ